MLETRFYLRMFDSKTAKKVYKEILEEIYFKRN